MLTFAVPDELRAEYSFLPGQHIGLIHEHDGQELRRLYSICSPATGASLRIAIKRVAGGLFSTFATSELQAGQTLRVMTPTGRFFPKLAVGQARHYGAIAAGSGITPIMSMIETIVEMEPGSQITLIYQNKTKETAMFWNELETLQTHHAPRIDIRHILSRDSAEARVLSGRLDRAMLDRIAREIDQVRPVDEWFLCAPSALVSEATNTLRNLGVPEDRVHHELFAGDPVNNQSIDDVPPIESQVTIIANGAATDLHLLSVGEPVLVAALNLRPELPYACRDGVCATCRALVVEGEVVMERCSALDRTELREGYVLACQAHPITERVVLDFDA